MIIPLIAIASSLMFTGIAIYITLGEHPARLACSTELAATVFGPSYHRAAKIQAALAIIATIAGVLAWLGSGSLIWLIAAALIFLVIPFTFMVIMPINKQLLDPNLDRQAGATRELLIQWGKLHRVRSVLSILASILFLYASA